MPGAIGVNLRVTGGSLLAIPHPFGHLGLSDPTEGVASFTH